MNNRYLICSVTPDGKPTVVELTGKAALRHWEAEKARVRGPRRRSHGRCSNLIGVGLYQVERDGRVRAREAVMVNTDAEADRFVDACGAAVPRYWPPA
jgi:hypothetical protein